MSISNEPHSLEQCPKWKIPNTNYTIQGRSKAANRTGFMICELDIFFDIGVNAYTQPDYIFITHTHCDHAYQLPMMFINKSSYKKILQDQEAGKVIPEKKYSMVYLPAEAKLPMQNFLDAKGMLSGCVMTTTQKDYSNIVAAIPGTTIEFTHKNKHFQVEVVQMYHTVPAVGYILSEIRNKLLPEYQNVDKSVIIAAKKSGKEITGPHKFPIIAYLCDTDIRGVTDEVLNKCSTIMIECTFLEQADLKNALTTGHIHWSQLKEYVYRYPDKTFVLIHFSKRYKPDEIVQFFQDDQIQQEIADTNAKIALWLDSGVVQLF